MPGKAKKRAMADAWVNRAEPLGKLAAAGFPAVTMAEHRCCRVRLADNGYVDFSPSTGKWRQGVKRTTATRGKGIGIDTLLAWLAETGYVAATPPAAKRKPRPKARPSGAHGYMAKGVRPPRPHVTIFADASFDDRTGTGGWGAWIKTTGRPSITSGAALKNAMASSREAELCALVNAVSLARSRGFLEPAGRVLMLQSDCMLALGMIRHACSCSDHPAPGGLESPVVRRAKSTVVEKAALAALKQFAAETGCIFVTRHVKGHQQGDGRQWVNRAVDKVARASMKAKRAADSTKTSLEEAAA